MMALIKKFVPYQWYTNPDPMNTFRRTLCKGWTCGIDGYPQHQMTEMEDLIAMYANGTIDGRLNDSLIRLYNRGFKPAACPISFFYMLGSCDFSLDLNQSLHYLAEVENESYWACNEIMSYHPYITEHDNFTEKAMKSGAIWSMVSHSFKNPNVSEAVIYLKHLATAATTGWWKKRRSGLEYAEALKVILKLAEGDKMDAWATLGILAQESNLPAAIWIADGYATGEFGMRNYGEAFRVLKPYIIHGPWAIDLADVINSCEKFDKVAFMKIASSIGNEFANSIVSFPYLFQ